VRGAAAKRNLCEDEKENGMGALTRRYVTKAGAVKEYRYATVKGLPYKESPVRAT
jgi:hypothetical protein